MQFARTTTWLVLFLLFAVQTSYAVLVPPEFGPAVNVTELNTAVAESPQSISTNGLSIYLAHDSTATDNYDITSATRAHVGDSFGTPSDADFVNINTLRYEHFPVISPDGLTLFYGHEDEKFRITSASRCGLECQFVSPSVVENVNITDGGSKPVWLSHDGLRLYMTAGARSWADLYVATRPDVNSPFDTPSNENFVNLNAPPLNVGTATLTPDELQVFYGSNRPGGLGGDDIWWSSRPDTNSPFEPPFNLASINTPWEDRHPVLFGDALFFGSNRPGGLGSIDVWMAMAAIPPAAVLARHIFYNNSFFDDNDPASGVSDDEAIAPDKTALLPGETAFFEHYTSYSRGINGIMIDIENLVDAANLSADDFEFRVGNDNNPDAWLEASDPISVTTREGDGVDGSDRVTLIWNDNEIGKEWLQITVLANGTTGLCEEDMFFVGNAPGETGDDVDNAHVNTFDRAGVRDHPHSALNPANIRDKYDFDRNRLVNVFDSAIVRDNSTSALNALQLIDLSGLPASSVPEPSVLLVLGGALAGLVVRRRAARSAGKSYRNQVG